MSEKSDMSRKSHTSAKIYTLHVIPMFSRNGGLPGWRLAITPCTAAGCIGHLVNHLKFGWMDACTKVASDSLSCVTHRYTSGRLFTTIVTLRITHSSTPHIRPLYSSCPI